jgi:hypothetical protein
MNQKKIVTIAIYKKADPLMWRSGVWSVKLKKSLR